MTARRPRSRGVPATWAGWPLVLFCLSLHALENPAPAPSSEILRLLRMEARAYEHGEGVPKDIERAISLYCDGAYYGDVEAQFSLGWMYANGRGVERNDELASAFFQLAARHGHEPSRRMLRYVGRAVAPLPECVSRLGKQALEDDYAFRADDPAQRRIFALVRKLAPEYGVSPKLVLAVIRAESDFKPGAESRKKAQGLMQLIPETSMRFKVKRPFDPEQNIRGGMAYLRWLLAYFEGDVSLVAAAYNAGEKAVDRYRGIPPYAETRNYVGRILRLFQGDEHPFDPAVTAPSPELPRIRLAGRRPEGFPRKTATPVDAPR